MSRPQPSTYPVSEVFTGGSTSTIKGVSECYFPFRYKDISCRAELCKVDIKNFRQMEIELRFSLDVDGTTVENLYEDEYWKYLRTKYVMENNGHPTGFTTPAPLVALMLNKYLQVVGADLYYDGQKGPVAIDNGADLLILPASYPPLTELPVQESYVYYDKKSSVIYGNLTAGVEYRVVIKLESNAASFEFALLLPYKHAIIERTDTRSSSEYEVIDGAVFVKPTRRRYFPPWYANHLEKLHSTDMRPPQVRWALPERGNLPLFGPGEFFSKIPSSKEEAARMLDEIEVDTSRPIRLSDGDALRFGFTVIIPPNKNTDIIVRVINRPLPTRIYEQMQGLPNYRDVLVEYDIFNLSNAQLRLRIETEIPGYADKAGKSVFIHPLNNKKGQKARVVLNQCPRLQRGVLETIATPARATLVCRVRNEDTKENLFEQTYNLDLLPHDQIVWQLRDVRSNHSYNLHDFIAAWINPTDAEGLLDGVRVKAAEYHEDRAFGHATDSLDDIRKHVKAIWEHLTTYGMKYVSQPFTSRDAEASQRVVLPTTALKNKAGNCIDLSVLFASALEGVGIYSYIFLTESHAFIGWGDKRSVDDMLFLETTMLGYSSFEEALRVGRENFEKDFMFKGEKVPILLDMMSHMRGNHMVDLQQIRHSGLVSARR